MKGKCGKGRRERKGMAERGRDGKGREGKREGKGKGKERKRRSEELRGILNKKETNYKN